MTESILSLWPSLEFKLKERFNKVPDLQSVLYLIGADTLGKFETSFSKEDKQDLIHIGICEVLSLSNYFELKGRDDDGWPHYEEVVAVPNLSLSDQERLLKSHVIQYFLESGFLK